MPKIPLTEVGATGLRMWAGRPQERYLSNLQGPAGIQIFARMLRKEPACFTANRLVELTAMQSVWTVTPASDSPQDREAAQFLTECIHDMSHGWERTVFDSLSAMWYGFSLQEIVWKRRNGRKNDGSTSAYDDGRVGIRKLALRRQETIEEWVRDDTGGVQGVVQIDDEYQRVEIPIEKLLHFVVIPDRGNPEGLAMGEVAYKVYHMLENFEIIEGIGAERTFVGLPVFTYQQPPTDDVRADVESLGQDLAVNEKAYVAIPGPVVSFDLVSVTNANAADLRNKINQLRWEILSLVFGSFIRLGVGDAASRALSESLSDAFTRGIDALLANIAEVYNQHLVPRLFDYNPEFEISEYPRLQPSEVTHLPLFVMQYLEGIMAWLSGTQPEDNLWLREILGMPAVPLSAQPQKMPQTKEQPDEDSPDEEGEDDQNGEDDQEDADMMSYWVQDATGNGQLPATELELIAKALLEFSKASQALRKATQED